MEDIYKTSDLYLASVLYTFDLIPDELEKTTDFNGKSKAVFIYNKNLKKIAHIIKDYFDSKILIEPQKLFFAMKALKNRIYN